MGSDQATWLTRLLEMFPPHHGTSCCCLIGGFQQQHEENLACICREVRPQTVEHTPKVGISTMMHRSFTASSALFTALFFLSAAVIYSFFYNAKDF